MPDNEYLKKENVLQIVREAYQMFLPAYHGPVFFLENAISELPAEDVEEIKHASWIPTRKHDWYTEEKGDVDEFRWDSDFHNGPTCRLCYEMPCVHCHPDYDDKETCIRHWKCSRCGAHHASKSEYCTCGAKMED